MATLESVVLPLEQSRLLAERGIKLDTAMVWYQPSWGPIEKGVPYVSTAHDIHCPEGVDRLCPAPTLSELLDAIRARYPDAEVSFYNRRDVGIDADFVSYAASRTDSVGGYPTDLLAAYALLLEVAK